MEQKQISMDEVFRIVGKHVVEKELMIQSVANELEQKNRLIAQQAEEIDRLKKT